jgi:hypothetical protein
MRKNRKKEEKEETNGDKKTKSKKREQVNKKAKRVGKNFNKTTIKEKKTKIKNLTHKFFHSLLSNTTYLVEKKAALGSRLSAGQRASASPQGIGTP